MVIDARQPPGRDYETSWSRGTCVPDRETVQLLRDLADSLEADPVTSRTADELYAALARIAEKKRNDVEVVRGGTATDAFTPSPDQALSPPGMSAH